MRESLVGLALFCLAGCGGDTANQPSGLTAAQVSGTWDVHTSGCHTDDLVLQLTAADGGALISATNTWGGASSQTRPLDGSVDLSTGAAEFNMWADGAHDSGMLFTGTLGTDGSLAGQIRDPIPGFTPIFHFSGDADCIAPASGQRR